MYKCIIVDDEASAIEGLKNYINQIPNLALVASYTDPLKALKEISTVEPVDLIILDIDMPTISGLELSKEIRNKTSKLIFATSHVKYGYDAFEAEADAYLLKPYTLGKFMITVSKLLPEKASEPHQEEGFFFIKSKEDSLRLVKIRYDDVIAVESQLNYVKIHTATKKVLTYMSLTEISKMLSKVPGFIQFHRSFIIGKQHIEHIDGNTIRMDTGIEITVGEYYRKDFAAFVAKKLIKAGAKRS